MFASRNRALNREKNTIKHPVSQIPGYAIYALHDEGAVDTAYMNR